MKTCFQVNNDFEVDCMIAFKAPFSTSEKVWLVKGLVFEVIDDAGELIYAHPLPYDAFEPIFASRYVQSRRFAGYHLLLTKKQLQLYCTEIDKTMMKPQQLVDSAVLTGVLLGCAVGDSIGLPYEGLSRTRIANRLKQGLRQSLLFGTGMVSDDTEHMVITTKALAKSMGQVEIFSKSLAWQLRFWLLALPAGMGLATLKACTKLLLGVSAQHSGVYSAGNGPMMRAAIVGVFVEDEALRRQLIKINTLVTHTDNKALWSAEIIAHCASLAGNGTPLSLNNFDQQLQPWYDNDPLLCEILSSVKQSCDIKQSLQTYCQQHDMANGVSGYCYQTLPVVLHCILSFPDDFEKAVYSAISAGGDTDTVAAIVGAIMGAHVKEQGIPQPWLAKIKDYPYSYRYLRKLALTLSYTKTFKVPMFISHNCFPLVILRNIGFLVVVLCHGVFRALTFWR
jgi:ADP-ribosylglycohydrolase